MSLEFHYIDNQLHHIHSNTARGVDGIQSYAMNQVNNETIARYESALMEKTTSLKSTVNSQLDSLHQNITSRRPSPSDYNYEEKREQYRAFLTHANDGVGSMKGIFSRLFSKLFDVVKKIVSWIVDHLPEIVSAIAGIFGNVILPLLGFM